MYYNKEDLKFLNMKTRIKHDSNAINRDGEHQIFEIEDKLSLKEKIKFIDELENGIATYMLGLLAKWEEEKKSLPKDQYGNVKTVSKKAWINRNDEKGFTSKNNLGKYYMFGTKFNDLSLITPTVYSYNLAYTDDNVVHQWFHDLCEKLYYEEVKYFKSINPFWIKLSKVKEYGDKYNIYFGNKTINDIVWNRKEDVTEQELDIYLEVYEKLEESINNISQEISDKIEKINK